MPLSWERSWHRWAELGAWEESLPGRAARRAEMEQERMVYGHSAALSSFSSLLLQAGLGARGWHGCKNQREGLMGSARAGFIFSRRYRKKKG